MKLSYITNSTKINADLEVCILTNGEKADAHLALYFAPAYQNGTETALVAAYITSSGDPYPLAIENEDGEIFFGRDAFGGDAADYSSEFAEWLTPEVVEGWIAGQRTRKNSDGHFAFRLAEALRAARAAILKAEGGE